ncbi:MAG: hypothetical protein ABIB47_01730 [Candidatus Woesearchaeota archaeon]
MENEAKGVDEAEKIEARYDRIKDFEMDREGYFLIRVNKEKQQIEAGFCKKNNMVEKIIVGKKAMDVFNTIVRENLVSSLQHVADLGAELQKAEIALKWDIEYAQDEPLNFERKI